MSNPPFESSGGQIEAAEQVQSPLWRLRSLLWGFTREQPLCAPERVILTSLPPMEVCQVRTYHSNIQTPHQENDHLDPMRFHAPRLPGIV